MQQARSMARGYATGYHDSFRTKASNEQSGHHELLTRCPTTPNCTAYDILDQPRNGPHDKRRFYELAKVYHPDRWQHTVYHGISKATRVELYRLIVAANAILSNPTKQKTYDERGVGWDRTWSGGPGVPRNANEFRAPDREWRQRPGNASRNATWEDWERWRYERYGEQKQASLTSNARFTLILVLFMVIGTFAQFARVGRAARTEAQRHLKTHEAITADLPSMGSRGTQSRQELIEAFLIRRQSVGHGAG
jgi:curved DNA-binding protein CbpA